MSLMTERIISEIDGALHEDAVGKFAQVLANCDSTNFSVAQEAFETIAEARSSMAPGDFDQLLAEGTQFEAEHGLLPQNYLVG